MHRRALLTALGGAGLATGVSLGGPPALASADTGDGYEPLGMVEIAGACEAVVGDDGETVYVAGYDGFTTVDVSDPTDPTVLADERNLLADEELQFEEILDVKVSGDRLAVVGPGNQDRTGSLFEGFVLYDVSDPAEPERATDPVETGYHIHNCYLEDDLLFLVANDFERNPLTIYDVSDDDPEEVGRWSLLDLESGWADVDPMLWYLHDVYVQDEIAYLAYWNAGTYLLDVSDPTEPAYLSHVAETDLEDNLEVSGAAASDYQLGLPGNDHYSAVDETGDILAVNREAWETDAPEADKPGGVDIYDVSDPESPRKTAEIDAPTAPDMSYGGQWTTSHNFEISDGWLYTSWYQGGIKIHDLADLEAPETIASWRDPEVAAFWTARIALDGETIIASSTPLTPEPAIEGGLYVFASEPGEQADPPSFEELYAQDGTDGDDQPGANDTATNETDGTQSSDSDTDEDEVVDDEDDSADAIPGFTVGAQAGALAGGALAYEAYRRRRRAEDRNHDTAPLE